MQTTGAQGDRQSFLSDQQLGRFPSDDWFHPAISRDLIAGWRLVANTFHISAEFFYSDYAKSRLSRQGNPLRATQVSDTVLAAFTIAGQKQATRQQEEDEATLAVTNLPAAHPLAGFAASSRLNMPQAPQRPDREASGTTAFPAPIASLSPQLPATSPLPHDTTLAHKPSMSTPPASSIAPANKVVQSVHPAPADAMLTEEVQCVLVPDRPDPSEPQLVDPCISCALCVMHMPVQEA